MIIDTNNISDKLLQVYAYLIRNNFRTDENDEWNVYPYIEDDYLDFDKILIDGLIPFKFGYVGRKLIFERTYNNTDIKSLKNLPDEVDTLEIEKTNILNVDFLPKSEYYNFDSCSIKSIDYKFPERIEGIDIANNLLTNFNNFPKAVDFLNISENKFKTLKGCPTINDYAYIMDMESLISINELKGDYKELYISRINITQLPVLSKKLKKLEIRGCKELKDYSNLLKLTNNTTVFISDDKHLDLYTILQSKANLDIRNCDHFESYVKLFDELGIYNAIKIGRYAFEELLYNELFENDREEWEKMIFSVEEFSNKRDNFLNSSKVVSKFKL